MRTIPALEPLKQSLPTFKKALVLFSSTANLDAIAAGLSLSLALKAKGIEVQVASPAEMRVEFSRLVGVDQVKQKIGNRNLVVSFAYSEEKVEKVSYNISEDGKHFHLVIAPRAGGTPLDPSTVAFEHSGAEADATFLVGVNSYADLGDFYESERNVIEGSNTVAFTLFPTPTYAKIHTDAQGFSSLSELMTAALVQLDLPLDENSSSNLLFGIDGITQGLSSMTVTADTFETVATLMRAGGKRQPVGQHGTVSPNHLPYTPQPTPLRQGSEGQAASDGTAVNNNPFAAALSKTSQSSVMPAGISATGELKG